MAERSAQFQTVFSDTGGTFTDTFMVDSLGRFEVGKAATTPRNLVEGYFASLSAAAGSRGMGLEELCAEVPQIGYASTTAINAVLTRQGRSLALVITRGFDHLLLMQRGVQTFTEYDPVDRLHARTHRPVPPLLPQNRVLGVTERVDCLGKVIVPLYRQRMREVAQSLCDSDVEAVCVMFLYSWQNPVHELKAREILQEVMRDRGREMPIFLSHEISPIGRELPRCNDTLIEAYTREIVIGTLRNIEKQLVDYGYGGELHVMQSTGGVTTMDNLKVIHTLESGPAGGVMGAQYVGELYGIDNLITTDVGGTSFDVGLITGGVAEIQQEPICARMVLGVPMIAVHSIGAGGGTIARIDPLTGRLQVGPESAGADPGPVCYGQGGTEPTVTDADLVLGYLNPGKFLGGKVRLDKERAAQAIMEHVAQPLGLGLEEAAAGINAIVDARMRDTIVGMVTARGLEISEYTLLAFGGAGPSHAAAYVQELPLTDIMIFPFSSVFCAFGAATADFLQNYTRGVNLVAPPKAGEATQAAISRQLAEVWRELATHARSEMAKSPQASGVRLQYRLRMRYGRQLDQVLVGVPDAERDLEVPWQRLVELFEKQYASMFSETARYPQAGYEVVEASVVASVPRVKPNLPSYPQAGPKARPEAQVGTRQAYFQREWHPTPIYDWERLEPGNRMEGPAIVELNTQTLVIPPGTGAEVDKYKCIHLRTSISGRK